MQIQNQAPTHWVSVTPPWLPVGLGSGQVPGKLGAQDSLRLGPQVVQRPPGRGGREAAGVGFNLYSEYIIRNSA